MNKIKDLRIQKINTKIPKVLTACSHNIRLDGSNKFNNDGTAPAKTTACVWGVVPLVIFVKDHAASNCNDGLNNNNKFNFKSIIIYYYGFVHLGCFVIHRAVNSMSWV